MGVHEEINVTIKGQLKDRAGKDMYQMAREVKAKIDLIAAEYDLEVETK